MLKIVKKYPVILKTKINYKVLLLIICIATAIIYSGVINAEFVSDDYQYIVANPYIKDISWNGVKAMFANHYFQNYHPLTTLTWGVEYYFWKLNPKPFHITNLLLHIINTILVFILFRKLVSKNNAALFIAALFAFHPMHAETVSWISQRKDLVYTSFYIASLILYLKYLSQKKIKSYLFSLLLFIFSLLSKSMAVTLPVILIIIDYYKTGKWSKSLVDKIPFFILSAGFGLLTLYTQKETRFDADFTPVFPLIDRLFLVCYSICLYLFKLIIPSGLVLFHYYPVKTAGYFPLIVYASPMILAVITYLATKSKTLRKEMVFGVLFFIVSISVVLQFIPVGCAIISERYTYIPYAGLFFIIAVFYIKLQNKEFNYLTRYRNTAGFILFGFLMIFAVVTYSRANVWKDYGKMMNDLVEKQPDNAYSYYSRSAYLFRFRNDPRGALADINTAIKLDSSYADSYNNRGFIRGTTRDLKGALNDFNKAISLDQTNKKYFENRGTAKMQLSDFSGALSDFNKSLELDPANVQVYYNKGMAHLNLHDTIAAVNMFKMSADNTSNKIDPYYQLGFIYFAKHDYNVALKYFNDVIRLKDNFAEAYFNRGITKLNMKDESACNDLRTSLKMGYKQAEKIILNYCNQGSKTKRLRD